MPPGDRRLGSPRLASANIPYSYLGQKTGYFRNISRREVGAARKPGSGLKSDSRSLVKCGHEARPPIRVKKGRANDGPAFSFRMNSGLYSFPDLSVRLSYCTVMVWVAVAPLLSLTVMVAVPLALGVVWNWVALTWVRLS